MSINNFYTVVVIRIDMIESQIVDERHFANRDEADTFCKSLSPDLIGVIAHI